MKRVYPEYPIVGVAAVLFLGDSVLLARRDKEPGKGQWSLPGGAVELGETLEEALKREVFEETSIGFEVGGLVRVIDRIVHDELKRVQYHYVIVDFWGWGSPGTPRAGSDVSEILSVPLAGLGAMEIHREVKETILMAAKKRAELKLKD